jgi:3',5'-cyclic-AMP phosphodiesterase
MTHDDRSDAQFDRATNTRPAGGNRLGDEASEDGVDRRGFLRCMAWAGTATVWGLSAGVPKSFALSRIPFLTESEKKSLFFAQVSDSHIGFAKQANMDVAGTLQLAVDRLNALPQSASFVLHTGDITQLAKASEFDTAEQILRGVRTDRICYVPGEHDVVGDNGASYLARFGTGTAGGGWYSFDHSGVHFIGLVNVLDLKAGGLGSLGAEQLAWLKKDVSGLSSSTPIVLFAHVPLWTVYAEWGWGTDDSELALTLLKRFGSVTVLNGHIHQVMQKVEGTVSFHTALSTAFPQPAPGSAPSPGPMTVDASKLRDVLGLAQVKLLSNPGALAVVDETLSGEAPVINSVSRGNARSRRGESGPALQPGEVAIANFAFAPTPAEIKAGRGITWINQDDAPHVIASKDGAFTASKPLDTNERFSAVFPRAGTYDYYCAPHPHMQGRVIVQR